MLIKLEKSPRKNKKYRIYFVTDDGYKTTDFGAGGMEDFTIHKNKERKERFLNRFNKLIKKYADNPFSPMTLSHLILWNKPNLKASLKDYAEKFNLNII